ncbi:MAG: beta-ketoacyl-[acyl-carrier-protein] synthase family protein [Candidatus Wallbacteria bacterium]|nr:beta-ketoacyl-[acyl-carrier-protein] synthase family protein [Candidatus Wallbacteria bacterium]
MNRVVITGLGVVSPVGGDKVEHFSSLLAGRSGISMLKHFNASTIPVRIGGEVKNRKLIPEAVSELADTGDDKIGFGYSAFLQAYQDAGFTGEIDGGLNLGVSLEMLPLEKVVFNCEEKIRYAEFFRRYSQPGQSIQIPLDTLSRYLIRKFRLSGPCFLNCSACAAGTQAIGHSFRKIRRGDVKLMFAGGFDSMLNPLGIGGFSLLGALSQKNELGAKACRPFDRRRDGAVLGEGAGVIVLEELESALNRKAKIYGEIIGYGSSLDAYRATDPDPGGEGAALSMRQALRDAAIEPADIGYINAHGTSTPKNDVMETLAIKKVFGESAGKIPVSSTKSMIGHLIAAAGAVETISSLTGFIHNRIHPTINYEHPDPECDLDYVPNQSRAWNGRYILKNSFGFGGQNACLILKRWEEK